MKEYDMEIFDKFKFVIYDEAHHCASKVYSRSLYKTGANYTLALTATPDRVDGLKKVMDWYLGPTLHREYTRPNKQVLSYIFKYNTKHKLFTEKSIYRNGKKQASMPIMVNNLVELSERNTHILNIISQIRKFPDRKILILSGRINHLKFLKDKVDIEIKKDVENNIILENEIKTYFYIGGMKDIDRREAELNADILFATYDTAHEGLDIDRLNTIILSTPKKNIIQSVGRVMRRILKNGDKRPLIIDFSDELSIFKNQGEKRIKDYNSNLYKILTYYINKDKLISHADYLKTFKNFTDEELEKFMKPNDYIAPTLENILDDIENIIVEDMNEEIIEENVKEIEGFDDYLF